MNTTDTQPTKVAAITATWSHSMTWDLNEHNIDPDTIDDWECKWNTLYITLKDGTELEFEGNEPYLKYPESQCEVDSNYNVIEEQE